MTRPLHCILSALFILLFLQPAWAQRKHLKKSDAPLNVEMVLVKGGSYDLGDDDEAADRKPAHTVTLKDYNIGRYEVTQLQWELVMDSNPSLVMCDDCPVNNVTYKDALAFVAKLNSVTGKHYRLPTEAEWEYAARGGVHEHLVRESKAIARGGVNGLFVPEENEATRKPEIELEGKKYAGRRLPQDVAWYERNSREMVHPVGRKKANQLDIYDMSGNVEEWCSDFYAGSYGSKHAIDNPQGPVSGNSHVVRGGSYRSTPDELTVTRRAAYTPDTRSSSLGFRLVLDK